MSKLVRTHRDLEVWTRSFDLAMRVFELSKSFPTEERYALTDQIRRSSRSVTTNISEAWRRRRYLAAFCLRLNDAEAESAETQDWIQFAVRCGYLERRPAAEIFRGYEQIIRTLVGMIANADRWTLPELPAVRARRRSTPEQL